MFKEKDFKQNWKFFKNKVAARRQKLCGKNSSTEMRIATTSASWFRAM